MEYKGYVGSVEFSEEDGLLYGKVQGIRSLLSYEGKSVAELKKTFMRWSKSISMIVRKKESAQRFLTAERLRSRLHQSYTKK